MQIETLGKRENPAIIMIPGMFCTSEMTSKIGKYFENDYYLILPTLDGHYEENPRYISKQQDCKEMLEWLHANDIKEIALLQGTSMGAEVALEIATHLDIPVQHYLYDGGPFFYFPGWVRKIMLKKFMGKIKDFASMGQWVDQESVKAMADTCYKCSLPELSDDIMEKTTFLFASNEPARLSENRLKKKYSRAHFCIVPSYGHCGFQLQNPDGYAEYMRKLIEG